jgi:membrane-associated phospholipid phosphatase
MSAISRRPLLCAGACWLAFGVVLVAAYWLPIAQVADAHAVDGFFGLQRPWLVDLATRFTLCANPVPFGLASAGLAALALVRGRPRLALGVLVLLIGANVTSQTLKSLLAHNRAHDLLSEAHVSAAAFPSGHATASMSLAFAAVLVAPVALRPLVAVAGALFSLAVSESVLLLTFHYPSDVIGGYLVATSFGCFVVWALRAADARWPERTGREAARRALAQPDLRGIPAAFALLSAAVAIGVVIAAPGGAARIAEHRTTATAAVLGVAALAAALPAVIAALSTPRT